MAGTIGQIQTSAKAANGEKLRQFRQQFPELAHLGDDALLEHQAFAEPGKGKTTEQLLRIYDPPPAAVPPGPQAEPMQPVAAPPMTPSPRSLRIPKTSYTRGDEDLSGGKANLGMPGAGQPQGQPAPTPNASGGMVDGKFVPVPTAGPKAATADQQAQYSALRRQGKSAEEAAEAVGITQSNKSSTTSTNPGTSGMDLRQRIQYGKDVLSGVYDNQTGPGASKAGADGSEFFYNPGDPHAQEYIEAAGRRDRDFANAQQRADRTGQVVTMPTSAGSYQRGLVGSGVPGSVGVTPNLNSGILPGESPMAAAKRLAQAKENTERFYRQHTNPETGAPLIGAEPEAAEHILSLLPPIGSRSPTATAGMKRKIEALLKRAPLSQRNEIYWEAIKHWDDERISPLGQQKRHDLLNNRAVPGEQAFRQMMDIDAIDHADPRAIEAQKRVEAARSRFDTSQENIDRRREEASQAVADHAEATRKAKLVEAKDKELDQLNSTVENLDVREARAKREYELGGQMSDRAEREKAQSKADADLAEIKSARDAAAKRKERLEQEKRELGPKPSPQNSAGPAGFASPVQDSPAPGSPAAIAAASAAGAAQRTWDKPPGARPTPTPGPVRSTIMAAVRNAGSMEDAKAALSKFPSGSLTAEDLAELQSYAKSQGWIQ